MYLLGYDIGSSSVKASLVDAQSGVCLYSAFSSGHRNVNKSFASSWAEQDPEDWWQNLKIVTKKYCPHTGIEAASIKAIGISHQMHGLDWSTNKRRSYVPAIIWCDSRAVPYGEKAFRELGAGRCLSHLLNSPGKFYRGQAGLGQRKRARSV